MRKIILCVSLVFLFVALSACSVEPVYYSREEVMKYALAAFGDEIKAVEVLDYPYDEEDGSTMFEFVFEDKYGMEFSVYNTSSKVYFTGSETIFFEKDMWNDYIEKMAKYKKDDIEVLVDKYGLNISIEDTYCSLDIEDMDEIELAANFIEELDTLLSLEYKQDVGDSNFYADTYTVYISVKPNVNGYENVPDDWSEETDYAVARINISNSIDTRKNKEDVFETIERAIVYDIKDGGDEKYVLPQEVLDKYPAEYLSVGNEEISHEEFSYYFSYYVDEEKYFMENLDPCQESIEGYNYYEKGAFKFLVEALGGQYESKDYKAKWEIGGKIFYAELVEDEDGYYRDFVVFHNEEKIELDENGDRHNGTVTGRGFSLEDLEKILNVNIHVDSVNAVAIFEVVK